MGKRPHGPSRSLLALFSLLLTALTATPDPAGAQYFGRNKVQYDRFDFRILPTERFEVHFYPPAETAAMDAARMAERWYVRHLATLRHEYTNVPLIFYADPPDFQQSNVIEGFISQGTGGVTESLRERVIMPFTGVYAETDHVLGHELVHVSQYRIAESVRGGIQNLSRIPLWLIEGMAEYLSLARDDPNTTMWLRDALRRNDLPTINQLTNDARYFPYRYGQALWAFIGGTWGDDAVNAVFRGAVEGGWEASLRVHLGTTPDSLSAAWHAAIRREMGPELAQRTAPDALGRAVVAGGVGDQNVAPSVSPDGRYVAFFSSRGLFGMDLYIAEVATGRTVKQVTSVTSNPHFDALSFINSAGSWSPDGRRLAVVVYAQGDNEINLFDVESGDVVERIRPAGVTAMSDPAWSPDGQHIAFSGMKGGISDLYVHNLADRTTRQLTNDREAQIHPAWSPDGRTIAFATDAGEDTDFGRLSFGEMRLALADAASGAVRLLPRFERGKHINPQFNGDGSTLFFISDRDGVSDIYRLTLATGEMRRVTRVATGISGITALSPTLSVSPATGALLFTVFNRQGYAIRALEDTEALGVVIVPGAGGSYAGILPPIEARTTSAITRMLNDPVTGLPTTLPAETVPYRSSLGLNYIGAASAGIGFSGTYGVGVAGGVALGFSDMLGDRVVNAAIQAQGSLKDIGAQAVYLNRSRRLNWGFQGYHIPLLGAFAGFENTTFTIDGQQVPGTIFTQVLQRVFYQNLSVLSHYPLSTTNRFEFSAGVQRVSFDTEVDSFYVVGNTVLRQARAGLPSGDALTFGTGAAAYVGDYSFFGFTSPVAGGRYRFEVAPYVGSLNYGTVLLDYRRYLFAQPFTLAFRGFHFGRYGSDAESGRLSPLYVGYPTLVRGYDVQTFTTSECTVSPGAPNECPEYDRLNGSRVAVANVELRIPLFGTSQFGLLNVPFLPTEIAPFLDVGVAWTQDESPELRFDRTTSARVPVFSAGISTRLNLLGAAIVEIYWAKPYQRPGKKPYFGFQLAPGW